MSLINEALKKAQSERQSSVHNHPAMQGMTVNPQQQPPKRKRYLFGFVLAVLIIALFSTLVSTYLLYQIVGDDASQPEDSPPATEMVASQGEATPSPQLEQPAESVEAQPPAMDEPVARIADSQIQSPAEPATEPEPVAVEPEPVVPELPPAPVVKEPAPQIASIENNPLIWKRIEDLEIRGIMSGGTKVLIFDTRNGKARAYKPGDLVDGALSLKLSSISQNLINFENNDGFIFPKAF